MRRLVYLTALLCACQQVSDLKQKYFPPETPWTHLQPGAGPVVDRLAGPCWIPTYSDDYYGFAVGQPTGWKLDFSTGTLMVVKDDKELEGVMIYPTRLRRATPPEELAAFFAKGIGNLVRSGGGTFELVDKTTDGRIASGLMLATIDGVRLRGPLQVIASPGFATLKAYWAPETELDKEEPTLKQIVSCFQRKMLVTAKAPVAPAGGPKTSVNMAARQSSPSSGGSVQPLQPYRGRFMAAKLPAGWRVQDETQYGIDVTSADRSMGAGFGWFMHPFKRADVMAMEAINTYYPGVRILNAGWEPAPEGWQVARVEFEGQPRGVPTHGVERVAIGKGIALTTGWTSGPKVWDSVHATLEAVAGSVEIQQAAVAQVGADIRRQIASYPHPAPSSSSSSSSSKPDRRYLNDWARQDKESEQRSDAMLDQERAISPSTGETYVVPTNAWNPNGPDGAGYYRPTPGGGQERLEPKDPNAPAD